jgi:fused signal recognition particle receptor
MFDKLRTAFSSAAKSFSEKELKEKDIEDILFELEIALLESDVASEVIDSIKSDLKEKLIGSKVDKEEIENFVKNSLIQNISSLFEAAGSIDLKQNILAKKDSEEPYIILFVGINGTGKTTSLAKLAYLLQKSKISVVVAAADTFRAGAIEQLKEHTNRLNLKLVAQNYGSDPAAVCRDAVLYAKSHKIDCVLIDTAGRMQTSKNLMDQISKINNVVKPDFKIFVGDSLAGNDTVNQAREFHAYTKFDASILTKSDADARGGAALSIVKVTSTPILYVGVGQEYEDLKEFNRDTFLETVFGSVDKNIEIPEIKPEPKPEPQPEEKVTIEEQESESDSDPFEGINSEDINKYANLYGEAPPESDIQARELAKKIRKWVSDGRPNP